MLKSVRDRLNAYKAIWLTVVAIQITLWENFNFSFFDIELQRAVNIIKILASLTTYHNSLTVYLLLVNGSVLEFHHFFQRFKFSMRNLNRCISRVNKSTSWFIIIPNWILFIVCQSVWVIFQTIKFDRPFWICWIIEVTQTPFTILNFV